MSINGRKLFSLGIAIYSIISTVISDKLDGYSQAPDAIYHGRYTRDINKAELVIPRRVHSDGGFHTYELPKYYDRRHYVSNGRRKRSVNSRSVRLHLMLPIGGLDHHVELEPYHEFISPRMVIERRSIEETPSSLNGVEFEWASDRQCHYRGSLRGQRNSRAVLSLCDGVVGYVHTDHGRYFIEPLNEDVADADGQHIHVVYKKEAPHELGRRNDRFCGIKDDWENAWSEQLARLERDGEMSAIDEKPGGGNENPSSSSTHSIHRYIELAVVADRKFIEYHNNTNYEEYLLTVINMVADFYHDASVGNQIDVVVVRMIFLEKQKDEINLHISTNGEKTLDSFAKWIAKLNPTDPKHPNHFDIGALVTRYDICAEGNNCNLMGLAYVAAACEREKAACINEDSGLLLGIVIAHEIGHTLGCSHDTEEISGCSSLDKDQSYFVMSPIVFIYTVRWSTCSRKFISTFLESGLGECLNNNPKNPPDKYKFPNMLPGAMYDAAFQCKLAYSNSTVCEDGQDCEELWCNVGGNNCKSRGAPPADGTKCGENKWCIHKKCVEMGSRGNAVNGGWAHWGKLGECSRSCGGGVQFAERECNNPVPKNGGRYCIGERKKFTTCNTKKVGCDWIIDSEAVEDVCGVCKGGGTDCKKIEGDYKDVGKPGYAKIAVVPKDSRNVRAYEMLEHENTLAIKLASKDKYCLNGNLKEEESGEYSCAGSTIVYKHVKSNLEEIAIKGPINEPIEIQYVFYELSNPGVHYEYYTDTPDKSYRPRYSWEFVEWTDCDAKCAGGTKISEATCTEERAGKVISDFCKGIPRPPPKSQICNEQPCPAKWRVSQWSRCTGCSGKPGEMRRKIQCVRSGPHPGDDYIQANFDACQGKPPPQVKGCVSDQPCRGKPCVPKKPRDLQRQLEEVSLDEMIDRAVDHGLLKYLEKSRGIAVDQNLDDNYDDEKFDRLLKEWTAQGNGKGKHHDISEARTFTTAVPGSIVIDSMPRTDIVVYEAPENFPTNMSDIQSSRSPG